MCPYWGHPLEEGGGGGGSVELLWSAYDSVGCTDDDDDDDDDADDYDHDHDHGDTYIMSEILI